MGEEVRDPQRTIPRAILIALSVTVAVYLVVGVAALWLPVRISSPPPPLPDDRGAGGRRGRAAPSFGSARRWPRSARCWR
jgi:APA family basic amino acid/polyamine antiporter